MGLDTLFCLIANATNEIPTFHRDIHRIGYKEFHATHESVDFNLFVFRNGRFPQVKTNTSAKDIQTGTMKRFTSIYIFVATITNTTADALAFFGRWYGSF